MYKFIHVHDFDVYISMYHVYDMYVPMYQVSVKYCAQ